MVNIAARKGFLVNYSLKSLKGDIFGAVTAAVIALPVALAYGVASGVGAVAGLYAAIAIAFFAAVFGGTPSMVSGPTVAVTVAMAVIVTHSAANLAEAFTIVMFAGLIQIGIGAFRLGKLITYTPYSVISGFLTGIGVILISMQILPVLGAPAATDGIRGTISNLPDALSDINLHAFAVAALTLAMLLVWQENSTGLFRTRWVRYVSGRCLEYWFFRRHLSLAPFRPRFRR